MDYHEVIYIFFAKLYFTFLTLIGFSRAFAPKKAQRRAMIDHKKAFSGLTHDQDRYNRSQEALKQNPDLFVGWGTYGWLSAASKSIAKIQRAGFIKSIKTEILFILSGDEKVVNNKKNLN